MKQAGIPMNRLENQIPRYDVIRKQYESRYYVVDSNMKGTFRFAYGISNDEAILKDGTSVKCSEIAESGNSRIKIDNPLIGIARNCYIKVGRHFYLVNYIEDDYIYIYGEIKEQIDIGQEVRLYSTYVTIDNVGNCTEIEFKIGTILSSGDFSYKIKEEDTVESVVKEMSKHAMTKNFGDTIYSLGMWTSSASDFITHTEYPVELGFLNVSSLNFIVKGDDLVLFNEDVRASNIVTVEDLTELDCSSGFRYTIYTKELSGTFKYGQLRAFPAYKSTKLNISNLKPSLVDLCGDTVYGKDIKILKGIKTFYKDEELTNGFEDLKYIANLITEPSDLWLNEVMAGKIEPILPNLKLISNEEGFFRMYIDSKIDEEFVLKFEGTYPDTKISITDVDGNILALGNCGEYLKSRLNKVTLNIQTLSKLEITLDTFKCLKQRCTHIEYYFVCRELNNERVEVNGLHLNPIFKNYRELLAVIGRDKAGEGRIAL